MSSYNLTFSGNYITVPNEVGGLSYTMPTGTYVDVLWSANPADANNRLSGELSNSIYNYDLIKIYPWHGGTTEQSIGTLQSPKDLPWGTTGNVQNHLFSIAGQGNIYMTDQMLRWTDGGTKFSAFPINANSASIRGTSNTISGTTAKNWANFNQYNQSHCGIGVIMGVKYNGNRDLLYSADVSTMVSNQTQVCNLASAYSAYDRLQVHLNRPGTTAQTNYENGGTWTEVYNFPDVMKGIRPNFLVGGGGACYLGHKAYTFTSPTQLSGGPAKSFIWSINSTAAPQSTTAHSGTHVIQEIWGVKDA